MLRNEFLRAALAVRPMTLGEINQAVAGRWSRKSIQNGLLGMTKQMLITRDRVPSAGRMVYRYTLSPEANRPRHGRPDHIRRLILMQLRHRALSNRELAERCELPVNSVRGVVFHLSRAGRVRRLPPAPGQRHGYRYTLAESRRVA